MPTAVADKMFDAWVHLHSEFSRKVGYIFARRVEVEYFAYMTFEVFEFNKDIRTINDLKVGMQLVGIVTNITAFGCFVDVGVHQDGLVHISQMSNQFIKDPNEIVKLNQKVRVTITEVDVERKRISLSMKNSNLK